MSLSPNRSRHLKLELQTKNNSIIERNNSDL